MSSGRKSVVPAPGRYRVVRDSASETVRLPALPAWNGGEFDEDEPSRLVRRGTSTIPAASNPVFDRNAVRRATAVVDDLAFASPGVEAVFIDSLRALGKPGLEAVGRVFPGSLWFDRHASFGREPLGRFSSPLASALYQLGASAHGTIASLLESPIDDVRYYAALLAVDVDADELESAMRRTLFDEDPDVARLALAFCRSSSGRAWRTADAIAADRAYGAHASDSIRVQAATLVTLLRSTRSR